MKNIFFYYIVAPVFDQAPLYLLNIICRKMLSHLFGLRWQFKFIFLYQKYISFELNNRYELYIILS